MLYSILIRTRNEESWIRRCLASVFSQLETDFEVILIDNCSEDDTLSIAKEFPIGPVLHIKEFYPGKALMMGARAARGKYVVALSAHCVPVASTWLAELKEAIETRQESGIVAAYGRQVPISSTSPADKRDLLNTFGLDFIVQENDFFFHNANSIVFREYLLKFPYSESVTNVEDRIWAKDVISRGDRIAYTPKAMVYHHHGINHDNDKKRLGNVTSLIEPLYELQPEVRSTLEEIRATAVIAATGMSIETEKCIDEAVECPMVKTVIVISDKKPNRVFANLIWIPREEIVDIDKFTIPELVRYARNQSNDHRTEFYVFLSPKVSIRPRGLIETLLVKAKSQFLDVCFVGSRTYSNLWILNDLGNYAPVERNLALRQHRSAQYEAHFGLGLVMTDHMAKKGTVEDGHTGIFEIELSNNSSPAERQ